MITISVAHNIARLEGTRNFVDTGTGVAVLAIYGSARVAIDQSPSSVPICEIPLQNPSGTVNSTGYTLLQASDGFNDSTGTAVWARLFTRTGSVCADFDVRAIGDAPELGEIALSNLNLYAGGATRLTSAKLT